MERRVSEICLSGVFIFLTGFSVWPPGNVYWNGLAARAGFVTTIAVVMILCGIIGVGIALLSDVSIVNLVTGGGIAYVIGMALLATVVSPFSAWEYVVVYGVFFLGFVSGAVATRTLRYRLSIRPVRIAP